MSTIEDILNANDSDDDDGELVDGLDLDALLEDSDGEDDIGTKIKKSSQSSISDYSLSSKRINYNISENSHNLNIQDTCNNLNKSNIIENTLNVEDLDSSDDDDDNSIRQRDGASSNNRNSLHNNDKQPKNIIENTVFRGIPDSLDLANRREQQSLKSDTKGAIVMSALTDKLNATKELSINGLRTTIKYIRVEPISTQLEKNSHFEQHGPGLASSFCIKKSLIAIGTSKGLILLFDDRNELKQVMGSSISSRCTASVRGIDATHDDMTLIVGYETGEIALWDSKKGTIYKRINDLHSSAILRIRSVPKYDAKGMVCDNIIVSVDRKGVVYTSKLVKTMFSSVSVDPDCLLDGSTGPVSELICSDHKPHMSAELSRQLLSIQATNSTYIVMIDKSANVILKWPLMIMTSRPFKSIESQENLTPPKSTVNKNNSKRIISLDWGWRNALDLISQDVSVTTSGSNVFKSQSSVLLRCYGTCVSILICVPTSSEIHGLKILSKYNDEIGTIQFLTTSNDISHIFADGREICEAKLLRTNGIVVLAERKALYLSDTLEPVEALDINDLTLSSIINQERRLSNILDDQLFLLFPKCLYKIYVQPWSEIIDQTMMEGKWLDALAMSIHSNHSMSYSHSNRTRGNGLLPVEHHIKKYIDLSLTALKSSKNEVSAREKSNIALVAGVSIDFCIHAKRLDVLFTDIYDQHIAWNLQTVFFEALEPYILSGKITDLPENILKDWCGNYSRLSRFAALERNIVHLNVRQDSSILYLCKLAIDRKLYSTLLYCMSMKDLAGSLCIIHQFLGNGDTVSEVSLGYKILLFLMYSFDYCLFPRGDVMETPYDDIMRLLEMLVKDDATTKLDDPILQDVYQYSQNQNPHLSSNNMHRFPHLMALLPVDSTALFYCISRALSRIAHSTEASSQLNRKRGGVVLDQLLEFCKYADQDSVDGNRCTRMLFSNNFDLILSCNFEISVILVKEFVRFTTSQKARSLVESSIGDFGKRHLEDLHQNNEDDTDLLLSDTFRESSLWCAYMTHCNDADSNSELFSIGMESYLRDPDAPTRSMVFDFIDIHFQKHPCVDAEEDKRIYALMHVLLFIADIDLQRTRFIVGSHLACKIGAVVEVTRQRPLIQYTCLDAIALQRQDLNEPLDSIFSENELTLYVKYLALYESERVYPTITKIKGYNLEEILSVCENKGIFDATCYLEALKDSPTQAINSALSLLSDSLHQYEMKKLIANINENESAKHYYDEFVKRAKFMGTLCLMISKEDGGGRQEEHWVLVLDKLLAERAKAQARNSHIFDLHNGCVNEFMYLMAREIHAQVIIRCITRNNQLKNSLGEFRELLESMDQFSTNAVQEQAEGLRNQYNKLLQLHRSALKQKHLGLKVKGRGDVLKRVVIEEVIDSNNISPSSEINTNLNDESSMRAKFECIQGLRYGKMLLKIGPNVIENRDKGEKIVKGNRVPGSLPIQALFNATM